MTWKRDDRRAREAFRSWSYWLLYKTRIYNVEWQDGTFRTYWLWLKL